MDEYYVFSISVIQSSKCAPLADAFYFSKQTKLWFLTFMLWPSTAPASVLQAVQYCPSLSATVLYRCRDELTQGQSIPDRCVPTLNRNAVE